MIYALSLVILLGVVRSQDAPDQVLSATASGVRSNPLFIAQSGIVVMEAESVPADFPWIYRESPVDDYTGSGYVRFDGNTPEGGAPNGTMSYYFEIQRPGKYQLILRTLKIDQEEGHLGNDCYTKLVGHPGYQGNNTKTFVSGANNAWITTTQFDLDHTPTTPIYNLDSAGVYEFELSGRSRDFFVDRIILFHTDRVRYNTAIDPSLPESPRQALGEQGQLSRISQFLLTSAGNDTQVLGPVEQNDVIDLAKVGNSLSMLAEVDGFATEVEFSYNGVLWNEGGAPYAMAGNQGAVNNPVSYLSTPGNKILRTTLYVEGFPQDTLQLSFTLIQSGPTAPPTATPTTATPTTAPTIAPTTLVPTITPTIGRQPTTAPIGILQLNRVASGTAGGTTSGQCFFVCMMLVVTLVAAV